MPQLFLAILLAVTAIVIFVAGSRMKVANSTVSRLAGVGLGLVAIVVGFTSVIRFVPAGTVEVETVFGRVTGAHIVAGAHVVNPLANWEQMNVRLQYFDFTGDATASSLSADGTQLLLDTAFNFSLSAETAPLIFEHIGGERYYQGIVNSAAREAIRSATAQFEWREAATSEREAMAILMRDEFERGLVDKLSHAGLTQAEAEAAFIIARVDLRRVQPPQRVLTAISEKVASQEDLERQQTLTLIAEEAARRRAQEGLGVQMLFAELPSEYSPRDIAEVLRALAEKERADALMKAVETGQVNVIVMNGGAGAVTLPMQ